jgi:pimeloyl-ACP methyl ester carboxylesterase
MRPVVLVHGAWHGAWCWHKVLDGLAAAGIDAHAVELPLRAGVAADVDATRTVLEPLRGAVVVGHSYGGVVISGAGRPDNVAHLVYLCAFQLTEDETTATILGAHPTGIVSAMRIDGEDRTIAVEHQRELFYGDCSDEDVAFATSRLRPMPASAPAPPPYRAAWRDVPSTYVVCDQDRAIHPAGQLAMAQRATRVVHWPSAHSPFLSRPELVVGLLAGLAASEPGSLG